MKNLNDIKPPMRLTEQEQIDMWSDIIAFWTWYPDLFLDSITPIDEQTGEPLGISLDIAQRMFIRSLVRFEESYHCYSRGFGKCVTGDTLLMTEDGMIEIGDIFDNNRSGLETHYYDLNFKVVNRYGEIEKSTAGIYSGEKPTLKFKTDKNYEIETTYVHPLLVMNKEGELEWKEAQSIKTGDHLVMRSGDNVFGSTTELKYNLDSWLDSHSKQISPHLKDYSLPTEMSEDLALLIGYLISDSGQLTHNKILLISTNEDMDVKFKNITNKLFNQETNHASDITQEFFKQIGLKSVGAKEIPYSILTAPKNMVVKCLQGMYDTNGSICKDTIEYCTDSEKLSKQLQTVLLNFGITSERLVVCDEQTKAYYYNVVISENDRIKFLNEIGFSCQRKHEQQVAFLETTKDVKLDTLTEENYYYAPVAEIIPSTNHVYDLYVPNTNSFIGNGFVNHNTLVELLGNYVKCILTPNYTCYMSAQSLKQSASLFKQKHAEILQFYPAIADEIVKAQIRDAVYIEFKSGAKIMNLANDDSAKGNRANMITSEESALMSKAVFDDAIQPIVSEPYKNQRNKRRNPYVINGLHFITTTYYASVDAYKHNRSILQGMVELQGKIAFGASWRLPVAFKRGKRESEVLSQKSSVSPLFWVTNYEERWLGGAQSCLVSTPLLLESRVLEKPEMKPEKDFEYYMGVDVARSENEANNQTSVMIVKAYRDKKTNKISKFQVPFLFNIKGTTPFSQQAIIIKRMAKLYNVKCCVLDANGSGTGLNDCMLEPVIDHERGVIYDSWEHIDYREKISKDPNARRCYFPLKAQGKNHEIIVNFMSLFSEHMIELLKEVDQNSFDLVGDFETCAELNYIQTDLLIEELLNLKTKITDSTKKLTVERINNKFDKDRYSALAYVLYYVMTHDNGMVFEEDSDEVDPELMRMLAHTMSMPRIK